MNGDFYLVDIVEEIDIGRRQPLLRIHSLSIGIIGEEEATLLVDILPPMSSF
jgi:hypothetical protein